MLDFRRFVAFIFLFFLFSGPLNASEKHNKAFRTFWNPTFLGERLDYCTLDGRQCGKTVANRYCRLLGYEYSSHNAIAYNVGLTHFLASRVQCKGWRCNGFMMISCVTRLPHIPPQTYHYREKKFAYPRYRDYRVDWCYDRGKGCGSRSANSFCSRMGFMRAKEFVQEHEVRATKAIGSQELCFGNQCNAFKMIVCYR